MAHSSLGRTDEAGASACCRVGSSALQDGGCDGDSVDGALAAYLARGSGRFAPSCRRRTRSESGRAGGREGARGHGDQCQPWNAVVRDRRLPGEGAPMAVNSSGPDSSAAQAACSSCEGRPNASSGRDAGRAEPTARSETGRAVTTTRQSPPTGLPVASCPPEASSSASGLVCAGGCEVVLAAVAALTIIPTVTQISVPVTTYHVQASG